MIRRISFVLAVTLAVQLCICLISASAVAAGPFVPQPQTAYSTEFVRQCEGQQWFIDELERLLNANQKSIDTLTGPEELAVITSLGFAGGGIEGRIPAAIGELKELRNLFLAGNGLSGPLPDSLFALPKLQNLDLSENLYSGGIPEGFGTMPALRTLMLRGNAYTGGIPATILSNAGIEALDVSGNQLSGGLPVGLSGMAGLQYLAVSDNPWGGGLPDLSALTELKGLSAWNCVLTGAIPDSLYALSHLQVLDLAGNSLTGEISAGVGGLTGLQLLSLGGNELTGPIPAELRDLIELTTLDLSSNHLEGVVPDAFGGMDKLMELHLEENKLRGHLPDSLGTRMDAGAVVYARDNYLTGPVLARVEDSARNFCDGAGTEQYRMTAPSSLTVNETSGVNVWPLVRNRNLRTGDTWLKPMLPIECYTAQIENDPEGKVELTRDGSGIYVKAVPLPPPADPASPPRKQDIQISENIRLVLTLTDNTGSEYSRTSILLTTTVPSSGGGGGGSSSRPPEPVYDAHGPFVDGYPDGRFGPGDPMTREQAAKLVVAALGAEVQPGPYSKFTDVSAGRWSAPYIEYARRQGWLLGTGGGAFSPEQTMTRAEFAVFLSRVYGDRTYDEGKAASFPDVPVDAWYAAPVARASAMGLVQGMPDGLFHPLDQISRAEAVTVLNRLLGRDAKTADALEAEECPFSDIESSHWAYWEVMEASVAHRHEAKGG